MNENLDIFVFTHKDFRIKPTNPVYKIVSQGPEIKNTDLDVYYMKDEGQWYMKLMRSLSEVAGMFWVADNVELKPYVGTCHYRAYFKFIVGCGIEETINYLPDIEEIIKERRAIALHLPTLSTVKGIFIKRCDEFDWDIFENIIKTDYPDEYMDFVKFYNGHLFMFKDMFIQRKEDFLEMVKFQKDIAHKMADKISCKTDEDCFDYVASKTENYKNKHQKYKSPEYQSRLLAFICEIAAAFYAYKNFKNSFDAGFIMTEKKPTD